MGPRDPCRQAQHLRDIAEEYLWLGSGADRVTHDTLVTYAGELLERAQQIEEMTGVDQKRAIVDSW